MDSDVAFASNNLKLDYAGLDELDSDSKGRKTGHLETGYLQKGLETFLACSLGCLPFFFNVTIQLKQL